MHFLKLQLLEFLPLVIQDQQSKQLFPSSVFKHEICYIAAQIEHFSVSGER